MPTVELSNGILSDSQLRRPGLLIEVPSSDGTSINNRQSTTMAVTVNIFFS